MQRLYYTGNGGPEGGRTAAIERVGAEAIRSTRGCRDYTNNEGTERKEGDIRESGCRGSTTPLGGGAEGENKRVDAEAIRKTKD